MTFDASKSGNTRHTASTLLLLLVLGSPQTSLSQPVQWEQLPLSAPELITVAFDHEGRMFVGSIGGNGIYRSTDNGTTWTNVGLLYYSFPQGGIAFDSFDNVYVATSLGLFRSTSNGTAWERADSGLADKNIGSVNCGKHDEILVASNSTFRSLDGGTSWTRVLWTDRLFSIVEYGDDRMVGGGREVWESNDRGQTWSLLSESVSSHMLARDSAGLLYAASSGTFAGNFYRSLDTGYTWTRVGNGLPTEPYYISCIVSPRAGLVFASFSNGGAVWRSTNGGLDWSKVDAGLGSQVVTWLAIDGSGRIAATTRGGGLWRTTTSVSAVSSVDGVPSIFLTRAELP